MNELGYNRALIKTIGNTVTETSMEVDGTIFDTYMGAL
jgi:hypothetical protein